MCTICLCIDVFNIYICIVIVLYFSLSRSSNLHILHLSLELFCTRIEKIRHETGDSMDIITCITQRISKHLHFSDFDTDMAIYEIAAIMNEPLSETEKKDIAAFSIQLESAVCPNFKSIHDENITADLWKIAHWIIRSHLLLSSLMETLHHYSDITDYKISTEYSNQSWMIHLKKNDTVITSKQLTHYYGYSLISEIMNFITQNIMPE